MKIELGIERKFIFRMEIMRIFSVCGLMTTGRRNPMCKSLEMRAFLKLNRILLNWSDNDIYVLTCIPILCTGNLCCNRTDQVN